MQKKTLAEIVRDEIVARSGAMPFVRFMELALYCPNLGYYEAKRDTVGRHGDFYTSISVGNLFGELLAFQFAEWLDEIDPPGHSPKILEAGAHDGKLARDILTWIRSNRPELFEKIEYCILEPSARRRDWQRKSLQSVVGKVRWLSGFDDIKDSQVAGIIFSNELLDAFPVRRLGWSAAKRKWFEWGVAADGNKFVWTMIELAPDDTPMAAVPASLLEVLPNHFTVEVSPAAVAWWRLAAGSLHCGKLMTVDYGFEAENFFVPSRSNGTLRAFYRHHFADDLLANIGEQDLTCHVNFTAIQKSGEDAGLTTEFSSTQTNFLTQILRKTVNDKTFGEWTPTRARQFQTLTHPEHLGRAFQVLVQAR